jgi:hypothetical protein
MNQGREAALGLYRVILRLHKDKLPVQMRSLGDSYVKSEFRLHKTAKSSFLPSFFKAWAEYADGLRAQNSQTGFGAPLGAKVATLTDDQRRMLEQLAAEATEAARK